MSCFALVFSIIYGFKIEFFDFSVLLPVIIIAATSLNRKLTFDSRFNTSIILVFILLIYQILIQCVNGIELNAIFRLLRALIVLLICSITFGSKLFSDTLIIKSIFYSILIGSAIIIVVAIFPDFNDYLSIINGNDRGRYLRSSGLLAGFDIAGFLVLIGFMLLLFDIYDPHNKYIYFSSVFTLVISSWFTSRITIILMTLLIVSLFLKAICKAKYPLVKLILAFIFFALFIFLILYFIMPLINYTFNLDYFQLSFNESQNFELRHASQNENQFLWADMYYLPDNTLDLFFGTGAETLDSDVGYIKDIFRYGICGTAISVIAHYSFYKLRTAPNRGFRPLLSIFLICLFFLIFILNCKNGYFFTRGIFPITVLLAALPVRLPIRDFQNCLARPL